MTKVEAPGSDSQPSRSQRKEKNRRGHKKDKMKPPTKIVVRHLPPTMTEDEFLKQIELPDHDFFYYASADWSLGNCATCRAYITVKRYEDVFLFRDRFDGYVFVDSKGAEYPAIVEFSPFQGLLKNRSRRSDNKVNTIEKEAHYQQFLIKLEEEREAAAKGSETKLEFSLDRKKEEITSTPLLQYLANKKEKRREEAKKRTEEKRRQREEEKERRRQAQQQQQQVTKIISGNVKGSSSNAGNERKSKDNNHSGVGGDEFKNSRARRRAERLQRHKEQREKAEGNTDSKAEQNETVTSLIAVTEKSTDEKASVKESKKYSDKRERDRERNRNRREKRKQENSTASVSAVESKESEETSTNNNSKPKCTDQQISDAVRNFIRSAANSLEVGTHQKQDEEKHDSILKEKEVIKEQIDEKVHKTDQPIASQCKKDDNDKSKEQQKREDRRIRNKDRPSIAIYQPKPRQRASEESDVTTSNKDMRSNPTSDCESLKKEDSKSSTKKKVSRYSERRGERRSIQRQKSSDAEDCVSKALCKSSSCEEQKSISKEFSSDKKPSLTDTIPNDKDKKEIQQS